jgi:hypothetical protein
MVCMICSIFVFEFRVNKNALVRQDNWAKE